MTKNSLLIYTDLDGTLLDHFDYNHDAADDLLDELETTGIPVIPATSKTLSELLHLRVELSNTHPFIIENGAAIYIPENYFPEVMTGELSFKDGFFVKSFCRPRESWLQIIDNIRPQFDGLFTTFSQAGVDGIAEMTGLDHQSSARAGERGYGEPLIWHGDDEKKQLFVIQLEKLGASVTTGGRCLHVSGNIDKGHALRWMTDCYKQVRPEIRYVTLAAGDSQNDVAMLEAADIALIVRSPVHEYPEIVGEHTCYRSKSYGPEGWVEGVNKILATI